MNTTARVGPSTASPVRPPAPAWMAEWPVAHPRPVGDWTVSGNGAWGRLDPSEGGVRRVTPADDRKLPALARTLRRGELVGYRAGRRAVVAGGDRFVKLVRPGRVSRLVSVHAALADTAGAPAVPRILAAADDGAVDLSPVPGRSLHELLRQGAGAEVLDAAAASLVALHAVTPPTVLDTAPPDTATRWVGVVGRAEPEAARALVPLATRVDVTVEQAAGAAASPSASAELVVVHADCHDKNVFLRRDGCGFIDLDGTRLGRREEDVANLAVHVALRALQSGARVDAALTRRDVLVTAYRRSAPLDEAVLGAYERAVWFRLACLYRFRSSSRPLVPTLLGLASGSAQT